MNNREIFIERINSMFLPYREELAKSENITCENIGKSSGNISLLLHQQITRDYLNLYTPYRGLLLYFGLGAGKCHKKDTPIMMSDGSIKMVQDIKLKFSLNYRQFIIAVVYKLLDFSFNPYCFYYVA